jgi:spore coat polysaccharide biosynthesis protein SpsF (cytidylyltransferase family)
MRQEALVQARLSSQRLPGKVLRDLGGVPVLDRVLAALRRVRGLQGVVVATSTDPSDDLLAAHCRRVGVVCERGALHNVAGRLLAIATRRQVGSFLRVNADSPFLDPRVVEKGLRLFDREEVDVVTNVFPRSFPRGQSVEVVRLSALRRACAALRSPEDREHVTRHFYAHPEEFRIHNFRAFGDFSGLSLCVDTPADLVRARRLVREHPRAGESGWRTLLPWAGRLTGRCR